MTLNTNEAIARYDFARGEVDFPVVPVKTPEQVQDEIDECWALWHDDLYYDDNEWD